MGSSPPSLASGVRASELLGMRGRDVDWGNSMIGVVSKGSRAYQQVPTSPDALTWLRLYLSDGFDAAPDEPIAPREPSLGAQAPSLGIPPTPAPIRH